ncbi:MAG: hypothetical protein JWQ49_4227 [Edaphobacter sp.]|nr:hypothetical protein [Edaphobacter sp.]
MWKFCFASQINDMSSRSGIAAELTSLRSWPFERLRFVKIACGIHDNLLIRQGEQPPDASSKPFQEMQPQGLHQHHVGELLCDQRAARLRLAQFLPH